MFQKIIPSVLLLAVILLATPHNSGVYAATPKNESNAALLLQIQSLLELIESLKAKLALKQNTVVPKSADSAVGTLAVTHVSGNTYKLSGVLYPPKNCTGTEQYEFILNITDGVEKKYTLSNCTKKNFSETFTYSSSLIPFFIPELVLRYVDIDKNVWTNTVQARYKVEPSSDTIQKLNAGIKG
jgi:hypothetical protein